MLARQDDWRKRDDIVRRWLDERTVADEYVSELFPDLWSDFQEWRLYRNGERAAL